VFPPRPRLVPPRPPKPVVAATDDGAKPPPKPPKPVVEAAAVLVAAWPKEAPKAGGGAAEVAGAVALVLKPAKEDGAVDRPDVIAPKAGGAVDTAPPKAPNPPRVEALLETAGAPKPARGATVAVGAPNPPKDEPSGAEEAVEVPRLNPNQQNLIFWRNDAKLYLSGVKPDLE
jgi:ESCRT-I complex subunit TSG101